jgi:sulfite reductase (ferredoxin)
VIQGDLAAARKATAPFDILLPTARALLITRGIDAQDSDSVLREFEAQFIDTGLVADEFRALLTRARGLTQGWQDALEGLEDSVTAMLERVELLYSTLDGNLEFHPPESVGSGAAAEDDAAASTPSAEAVPELDLRGVACPMNFVKAKLKLETLDVGASLAIVLDAGEPVQNVPASLKGEGQEIVETTDLEDGHWRIVVRKNKE